ncbi:hypothetical protein B0T24DRAFT_622619 [Lasiosphaeria ovina]|uniref:Uncharacterized protein n=1 Tax=Lasiosphaeria ovina TaxID=92902 RepID=A0AAE0N7M3_9PEZI|nr:hypothetical protein B0T24DRAFT_622619 [Lasiosphaeria ovina]
MGSGTGGKEGCGTCSLFLFRFFLSLLHCLLFCRLTPAVYSSLCLLLFLICTFALSSPLLSPQAIFGVVGLCGSRPVVIKRASIYLSFYTSLPPVLTFVSSILLPQIYPHGHTATKHTLEPNDICVVGWFFVFSPKNLDINPLCIFPLSNNRHTEGPETLLSLLPILCVIGSLLLWPSVCAGCVEA